MTTVELVRAYFDAFNRHDAEAMFSLLHLDVVHDINEGGRETGIEAFKAFKAHMDLCYREQVTDLVLMASDDGSRVTAEFTCSGVYLVTDSGLPEASGQTYAIPAAAIFESEGGRITRVTSYYNLRNWIRSVS